ncbi:hypothetical protein ACGFXC_33375 [Streptomyces sp. NPDC048507]|uniref:hypothetical protein n=1 Tax=Streptomyces sp. NPDC048507 TaxID=3365560 RepID=UPI003723D819
MRTGRTTRPQHPSHPIAPVAPGPALRREVLVAYAAPALTAGAGGLLSGRPELAVAALTSIAGTSALVTALAGIRLRRRGNRGRLPRPAVPARAVRAVGAGLAAAAVAAVVAHLAVAGLTTWPGPPGPLPWGDRGDGGASLATWPGRLRLDLPLSAALAAALTTWRWHGAARPALTNPKNPSNLSDLSNPRKDTA